MIQEIVRIEIEDDRNSNGDPEGVRWLNQVLELTYPQARSLYLELKNFLEEE